MKTSKSFFIGGLLFLVTLTMASQELDKDWHLLDLKKDKLPGISLQQAYKLLKANKKTANPVIVAVLDSGIDINHEDLKDIIWVNDKEIADNGSDDDNNGYIDDINGWNFIGSKNGESLEAETLELTRLYREYKAKFKGKDRFNISDEEVDEYNIYLTYREKYEKGIDNLKERLADTKDEHEYFKELVPPLQRAIGKNVFSLKELKRFNPSNDHQQKLKSNFIRILDRNKERNLTAEKLIKHYEGLDKDLEETQMRLDYNYNLKFDGRKLVGDNYMDLNERFYGNPDVTKRTEHGTHVAGIIGAINDNKIGIDGIAKNVIIMPIRNTPMGDETDKDVANGIRYAVDNGAKIINMSFGKSFSPDKKAVNEAIIYAQEKGVLLIHAAGNDSKNTDFFYNYPTPLLQKNIIATNWIEVGASSSNLDEKLAASFSNYGKKSVDIFAPGVDIYSTIPNNKYDTNSGTSMAAPVVSGVAALLLSYFPNLTPEEVREIILLSGTTHTLEVNLPGTKDKVTFDSLSETGKIVNAYEAVKLAIDKFKD